jgi:hypothetical protein
MEFEISDWRDKKWVLFFGDSDTGTLFFESRQIGPFDNEREAIEFIERETGGKIKSSTRVD